MLISKAKKLHEIHEIAFLNVHIQNEDTRIVHTNIFHVVYACQR
jgi:hypothetical protein